MLCTSSNLRTLATQRLRKREENEKEILNKRKNAKERSDKKVL